MGVRGRLHKKKRKTAYMLDDRGRDSEFLNKVVSELRKTLDTVDNIKKKMGRGQKAEDKQEKGEEEGNKVENEERKKQKEEVKKKKKVERKRGMRETRRIIM